jgi:uncharacterized protein YehS (DUF1456 family)
MTANDEFRALYEASGRTRAQVAYMIGVTENAVKSWLKRESAAGYVYCPRYRLNAFRVALGLVLTDLKQEQRERVLALMRGDENIS